MHLDDSCYEYAILSESFPMLQYIESEFREFVQELIARLPEWKKGMPLMLYEHFYYYSSLQIVAQQSFPVSATHQYTECNGDVLPHDPTDGCATWAFERQLHLPTHLENSIQWEPIEGSLMQCLPLLALHSIVWSYAMEQLRHFVYQ